MVWKLETVMTPGELFTSEDWKRARRRQALQEDRERFLEVEREAERMRYLAGEDM